MNYYELRKQVSKIIPRTTFLYKEKKKAELVREKGRKTSYSEFNLAKKEFVKQERLLNLEEINSFIEISCRAGACPMPLNVDVWDGLICTYNCKYCFANSFRASLYTSFFDNSKIMGLRHCNPDKYKMEMDKFMKLRKKDPHLYSGISKAIAMEMPLRFGIRFEDFLPREKKKGISLQLLEYLGDNDYPLMINTKSHIVGQDKYLKALSQNKSKTAVHMTLISSDDSLLRNIEPGAPSYTKRIQAMENMVKEGIRVVARIEPFMIFVNDDKEKTLQYIEDLKRIGVKNITFDLYSYSANNPGIRQAFLNSGFDWDRIFLCSSDSQALGSLLLGKFMEIFRKEGFSCSTFDMGNVSSNDQGICCEVEDWFDKSGYNYGCTVSAARFIKEQKKPADWKDYKNWVNDHGGFLTSELEREVHELWNFEGNEAYSCGWAQGITAVGWNKYGMIWNYDSKSDHREDLLRGLLQNLF